VTQGCLLAQGFLLAQGCL